MNSFGHGVSSLIARRNFSNLFSAQVNTLTKLSTGYRINRASDGPARLIAAENLRAVLSAIDAESRSLQRADHVANTADAALGIVGDLLVDAEALAVANANSAGMSDAELQANQMELDSILSTIDRIAGNTNFNGDALLDGTATIGAGDESLTIESASSGDIGAIEIDGSDYTLADVGSGKGLNIVDGDVAGAQQAIRAARTQVSTMRGKLGAFSRHSIGSRLSNLSRTFENTAAAHSAIRDTDYAQEAANLNRISVLLAATGRTFNVINRNTSLLMDLLA